MKKGIVLFSAIWALAGFLFLYPIGLLTLSQSGEQILFSRRVTPGDTFQLAYLHSVARSEVREIFIIDSQYRMVLIETQFQGQGTGLPYNIAKGEKLHREGDWFRITGMQRASAYVFWRVQSQWNDRFRFKEEPEINFSARIGSGLIHIHAQKISLLSWLGKRLKGESF